MAISTNPTIPEIGLGTSFSGVPGDKFAGYRDTYKGGSSYIDPKKSTMQGRFDPNKGTVGGQLEGLLDPKSPLMKQLATGARQDRNASGLLRSGGTVSDVQATMLRGALPIAQQDAQTYSNMYGQDAQTYASMNLLDADYDIKKDFLNLSNQFDVNLRNMDITADEKQQIGGYVNSLLNAVMAEAGRALNNKDLDADGLQSALKKIYSTGEDLVGTISDIYGYDVTWTL